jgi:hypothetical protein
MAAHFKLDEEETRFLAAPDGAAQLFAGASGTETWIERAEDTIVRLSVQAVAVATGEGGSLEVCIELNGAAAKGRDGPAPTDYRLSAGQSVEVMVKGGERLSFKAYPTADHAKILRTVVWAADMKRPATPPLDSAGHPIERSAAEPAPAHS